MNINIESLAAGLLAWTWKSALLIAIGWCLMLFAKRFPASDRHRLWLAFLSASLCLPLLVSLAEMLPSRMISAEEKPIPNLVFVDALEPGNLEVPIASAGSSTRSTPPDRLDWKPVLFWIWTVGCLAVIIRVMISYWWLSRLPVSSEDALLKGVLSPITESLGIKRKVTCHWLPFEANLQPMTWGVFKPRIGIPGSAETWTEPELISIITHELAHVHRNDSAVEWGCQLILALQWWNPMVWLAIGKLRLERENACDDLALASGADRERYAATILSVATGATTLAPAMARGRDLKSRIERIMQPRNSISSLSPFYRILLVGLPFVLASLLSYPGQAEDKPLVETATITTFKTVVIDPGHGGHDSGAVIKGMAEKDLNLQLSKTLRDKLKAAGIENVVMTREDDKFLTLEERAEFANSQDSPIYISLHCSSSGNRSVSGVQLFFPESVESISFARNVQAEIESLLPKFRSIKSPVGGLRLSRHPAILIECGYITNPADLAAITTDKYRNDFADAVIKGIVNFGKRDSAANKKDAYGGIGMTVGHTKEGGLVAAQVIEGSPADKAGITADTKIVAITGENGDTVHVNKDHDLQKFIETIRGMPGSPVTLTIKSPGEAEEKQVTVLRERIKFSSFPESPSSNPETVISETKKEIGAAKRHLLEIDLEEAEIKFAAKSKSLTRARTEMTETEAAEVETEFKLAELALKRAKAALALFDAEKNAEEMIKVLGSLKNRNSAALQELAEAEAHLESMLSRYAKDHPVAKEAARQVELIIEKLGGNRRPGE